MIHSEKSIEKNQTPFLTKCMAAIYHIYQKYSILHVEILICAAVKRRKINFLLHSMCFCRLLFTIFFFSLLFFSNSLSLNSRFFFFLSRLNSVSCLAFSVYFFLFTETDSRRKKKIMPIFCEAMPNI